MFAHVIPRHCQKNVKFRRVWKNCRAPLQNARGVAESAHAAISTSKADKRTAKFLALQTTIDGVLVKTDRFVFDTFRIECTRQLIVDPGVIGIDVVEIKKNCQRLGVLRGIAQLDGSLDDSADNRLLPSGVAYMASGVAFCFMTQLSRYIEHMKFNVGGLRLTQIWDMPVLGDAIGSASMPGRLETHLFMNSKDQDVRCEQLMTIAVRTCYLHATLKSELPPLFDARPACKR